MSDHDLEKLPIASLAESNALVVTWVTNKQQQQNFVREKLYPAWKVKPLATWHWLKVLVLQWSPSSKTPLTRDSPTYVTSASGARIPFTP